MLFKSVSIYTIANSLNMGIPFLMLPVLTRYLSPYEYGLIATFQAMRTIGMITVRMGTGDAISRAYYDRDDKDFDFHKYVFNTVIVISVIFLLFSIFLSFASGFLEQKLIFPASWMFILPIVAIADAITNIPLKLWLFRKMPVHYSVFQTSKSFLDALLSLFLVIVIGLSWKGRVLAVGIVEVTAMIASLSLLIKEKMMVFAIDFLYVRKILHYGIPVFFHSLSFWTIGSVDRFFLNNMAGVATTGVYSVSYSIGGIIGLLAGSFGMAWTPVFYEKLKASTTEEKNRIVKFTYLYFIGMLLFALLLTTIGPWLLKIMAGKDFYGAEKYLVWIAFGNAFHAMYMIVCGYVFYSKRTHIMMNVTSFVAVVNLISTYSLIKMNGAIGAAQATFISYVVSFLLTWWFANRIYPMRWLSFYKSAAKA